MQQGCALLGSVPWESNLLRWTCRILPQVLLQGLRRQLNRRIVSEPAMLTVFQLLNTLSKVLRLTLKNDPTLLL